MSQLNVDKVVSLSGGGGTAEFQLVSNGNFNFDSGTFYIDSGNNRVGIGTTSPRVSLDIANSDGILVDSSNTSTTARTTGSGSDNVTINNFPDTLKGGYSSGGVTNANPFPLPPNTGLLVSSTGSGNIYNYHN